MAITVTLLGTGGPVPDAQRSQPALLVEVDEERYLVDCGDGTWQRILQSGISPKNIPVLLFTHLHVDHTFGYAPFVISGWFWGRKELTVLGPPGTRALTDDLFQRAYEPDILWRLAIGRPSESFPAIQLTEWNQPGVWLKTDRCCITALPVLHDSPSGTFALRVEDTAGHAVVVSADTAYCPALAEFARGADLLVHDAYLCGRTYDRWEPALREYLLSIHATPGQAAAIASQAGVRQLALTHLLTNVDEEAALAEVRQHYSGPAVVGRDLMRFTVGA